MNYARISTLFIISLFCLTNNPIQAQEAKRPWCEKLYVGDIRVPSEPHLIRFRNILRTNIETILSDIGGCSFIERNKGLEELLDNESAYFSQETLIRITNYTDQFMAEMKWVVMGRVRPTNIRNEYSLNVRIVKVATRSFERSFNYVFKITDEFDQLSFDRNFRFKFLEEVNEILNVRGTLSGAPDIDKGKFSIIPQENSLEYDKQTGRFSFKIPKYKLEHEPLNVIISTAEIYGEYKSKDGSPGWNIKANTIDIGRISIDRTGGQSFDLKWKPGLIKCNDFQVSDITVYSTSKTYHREKVKILPGEDYIRVAFPKALPADAQVQVKLTSENYKGLQEAVKLTTKDSTFYMHPTGYQSQLGWKLIPGWHEIKTGFWPLGVAVVGLQAYTIERYLHNKENSNDYKDQARTSTSFLTREALMDRADRENSQAKNFLLAATLTYGFHLFYSFILKPCSHCGKKNTSFELMPSYNSGAVGLNLNLSTN